MQTKRNLAHQAAMVGSLDILSALSERDKTVFQTLLAQPDSVSLLCMIKLCLTFGLQVAHID